MVDDVLGHWVMTYQWTGAYRAFRNGFNSCPRGVSVQRGVFRGLMVVERVC